MADHEETLEEIGLFMKMHDRLVTQGHDLAARKTRYALTSFFDSIAEKMAEKDGGKGMRSQTSEPEDDQQMSIPGTEPVEEDEVEVEAEAEPEPEPEEEPVVAGSEKEDDDIF